jgi:hypothetical protein
MSEPTRRMIFRDDLLEQEVRSELLCRVPPELTARLLALVPHDEVVFRATPRQRQATMALAASLLVLSLAIAWPLYAAAIEVSGLSGWLNLVFSELQRQFQPLTATWPTLQQLSSGLFVLQEVLQVALAAVLLWLGTEYLFPRLQQRSLR